MSLSLSFSLFPLYLKVPKHFDNLNVPVAGILLNIGTECDCLSWNVLFNAIVYITDLSNARDKLHLIAPWNPPFQFGLMLVNDFMLIVVYIYLTFLG